jgi:hypothetical protein
MAKEVATICVWLPEKAFGFASRGIGKSFQKFFFHKNDIISGTPAVGLKILFDADPIMVGPQPNARNVEVQEQIQTTAGQNGSEGGR